MQVHELTATAAVAAMRAGDLSPVDLVQALLERIAATEPRIHAWATLDGEGALAAARHLEAGRRERLPTQPLFGLPVGVKDILHARDLPTIANFEPYRGHRAPRDSGVVEFLREAGAVILGKTVTTQLARGMEGAETRNPWNLDRSPGGSSSGSAAAVAARQVPAAIGTQTGGSLLRPAAYCGVAALKPTFGRLSRFGAVPGAWSLDHPGFIVRCMADAALLLGALAHHDRRDPFSVARPSESFVAAVHEIGAPPRLALVRDLLDHSAPVVRQAAEDAASRLAGAGAEVREVCLPVSLDILWGVHFIIMTVEGAAVHAEQHATLADHYWPTVRASVEVGQLLPAAAYVHAARLRRRFRSAMLELVADVDGVVGPVASALPPDPSTTGSGSFQSIWTLFGFPNVALPTGIGADGLPRALQIVGRPFGERALLRTAAWCERVFGLLPTPL